MVPEPIGVFDRGEEAIYVARRQAGVPLSELILRSAGRLPPAALTREISRAADFLAAIHAAWGLGDEVPPEECIRARRDVADDFRFHLRGLGIHREARSDMKRFWQALVPGDTPLFEKGMLTPATG